MSTAPLTYISKKTGCKRPCSYKEYKFVNTNLKELTYTDYPDDQLVLCLWGVSQYTQVFFYQTIVSSLPTLVSNYLRGVVKKGYFTVKLTVRRGEGGGGQPPRLVRTQPSGPLFLWQCLYLVYLLLGFCNPFRICNSLYTIHSG